MKFWNLFKKRLQSYYIHQPYGRYDAETIRQFEKRYQLINELCINNPGITLKEIGDRVGLSGQRIKQLIDQYNERFPESPIKRKPKK